MASASPPVTCTPTLRADKLKSLPTPDASLGALPQPVVLAICGSFNPIHNAHFRLYEAAKTALTAAETTVLGGFFSPVSDTYGKPGLRSAAQRVKIIEDAVRDHPDLNVDTWECTRPDYTRTYYVLQQLERRVNDWYIHSEPPAMQELHAQGRRVRVVFVCGADLFSSFCRPGCWPLHLLKRLLDTFPVVVVQRDFQGGVKSAEDLELAYHSWPVLAETAPDGTRVELDMSAYHITFAQFDAPDDTSSTAVREVAAAMTYAEPGDTVTLNKLRDQLASMVPASAVSSVVEYYGNSRESSVACV